MMRTSFRRTQLLDTSNSRSADNHDVVWKLIPWYVNGSLPPAEQQTVKRHSMTCPDCAAEIARQHGLAKQVAKIDPFEPPLSRSWEKLRAQIKADKRVRKPRFDAWRWFDGFRGRMILTGAGAAACLMAAVLLVPVEDNFRTLTSDAPGPQDTIKFQMAPDIDVERLKDILAKHGLTISAGPSETGVYTATVTGDTDLQTASKALMTAPEIMFAAPTQQP